MHVLHNQEKMILYCWIGCPPLEMRGRGIEKNVKMRGFKHKNFDKMAWGIFCLEEIPKPSIGKWFL